MHLFTACRRMNQYVSNSINRIRAWSVLWCIYYACFKRKEDIELALLRRKKNDLEKEIARVKDAHRRHEFAEVNTFQLFVLENKLEFVEKKLARREKHDYN